MTSWQKIQYVADDFKHAADDTRRSGYCLCVEMDDSISCRLFPDSRIVQEKFLWSYVGGALVNKISGKVLEASADIGKPPTLRAASNPLRRSQTWIFEKNHILHSRNDRTLVVPAPSIPDQIPVIGVQYDPSQLKNGAGCWLLVPVHMDLVSRVDLNFRPASMPPQKIQERMSSGSVIPQSVIPPDDKINLRELLFDCAFCMKNNECYSKMTPEQLKKEWDENGIRLGRWGSPIFDVKFYLQSHPRLRDMIGANNYEEAAEYFVNHCDEPVQTSPLFDWRIYQKNPQLVHLTPKQLFWDYYHNGYKQHIHAA